MHKTLKFFRSIFYWKYEKCITNLSGTNPGELTHRRQIYHNSNDNNRWTFQIVGRWWQKILRDELKNYFILVSLLRITPTYCPPGKLAAAADESCSSFTTIGIFLHAEDFKMRSSWHTSRFRLASVQISTLFMTIKNGIFKATTRPRCSLVVPTKIREEYDASVKIMYCPSDPTMHYISLRLLQFYRNFFEIPLLNLVWRPFVLNPDHSVFNFKIYTFRLS